MSEETSESSAVGSVALHPEPFGFSQIGRFQVNRGACTLESKSNLGLDQAIKRRGTTAASPTETSKSTGTTVGFAEDRRAEIADWPSQVCVIQDILEVEANS